MSEDEKPKRKPRYYRVLREGDEWHVCVVYDEQPQWFCHVATFFCEDRATAYAEIENMGAADEDWDSVAVETEVKSLPAAPASPSSVVIPANISPPTAEEKARVASALLSEAAAETGHEITVTVEKRPLTEKQERVWRAMIDLEKAGNRYPSHHEIAERSGVPAGSMGYMLETLVDRGYCERSLDRIRVARLGAEVTGP